MIIRNDQQKEKNCPPQEKVKRLAHFLLFSNLITRKASSTPRIPLAEATDDYCWSRELGNSFRMVLRVREAL